MKKLFCLIAAAMMILASAAAEMDLSAMTLEELQDLRARIDVEISARTAATAGDLIYEDESGCLIYKSSEVRTLLGNRYLYLYFDWTNKAAYSFAQWATFEFWQDGVMLYGGGENAYTAVRPGATIAISLYCTLQSESDVELSLKPFLGFSDTVWYTGTFSCR